MGATARCRVANGWPAAEHLRMTVPQRSRSNKKDLDLAKVGTARPNPACRLLPLLRKFLGGLLDERSDCLRLRHVHGVASGDLDDTRARTLRHEALRRRRDHLVVLGDQVPAGLALPR